jgi:hypothetical protein
MLTRPDFESILSRIAYRKGWRFHLNFESDRPWMQVRFMALDVPGSVLITLHGRKWFLSPHMTESEVVATAFKALLTAEEHECRERFTYRGQRVFGPHIDVARVASLLESGELGTVERP